MRRSFKVTLAMLLSGTALAAGGCSSSDGTTAPPAPATQSSQPGAQQSGKTEQQAHDQAQDLLDNTVGNMP